MKRLMNTLLRAICAATIAFGVCAMPAGAETASVAASAPKRFVTEHVATIAGRKVAYTAIAEETVMPDAQGAPGASMFTFSYIANGAASGSQRPVAFIFNGGPGSSSIWQHIGAFGPRRVAFADDMKPNQTAPFKLQDSEYSLLDVADLVFIDYFGSGFSHLLPGAKEADFQGIRQDADTVASYIALWLTEHQRWNSPKYLIGESYGTIRAMVTADALAGGVFSPGQINGMTLNGVAVLGPYFGAPTTGFEGADELYLTNLPTMAATAWYHGRIDNKRQSLAQAIQAARAFAATDYVQALYAGRNLAPDRKAEVADRLQALTGLPKSAWLANDLRIGSEAFRSMLLPGEQLGNYDSRFSLPSYAAGKDPVTDDPGMGLHNASAVAAFNDYIAKDLKVGGLGQYVALDWKHTYFRWDRGFGGPGVERPYNYLADFAPVMRRNPEMRFFVAVGAYDFVTTIGKAEYDMAHSKIALDRTDVRIYGGGHQIYAGREPSAALANDLRAFLTGKPLSLAPPTSPGQ